MKISIPENKKIYSPKGELVSKLVSKEFKYKDPNSLEELSWNIDTIELEPDSILTTYALNPLDYNYNFRYITGIKCKVNLTINNVEYTFNCNIIDSKISIDLSDIATDNFLDIILYSNSEIHFNYLSNNTIYINDLKYLWSTKTVKPSKYSKLIRYKTIDKLNGEVYTNSHEKFKFVEDSLYWYYYSSNNILRHTRPNPGSKETTQYITLDSTRKLEISYNNGATWEESTFPMTGSFRFPVIKDNIICVVPAFKADYILISLDAGQTWQMSTLHMQVEWNPILIYKGIYLLIPRCTSTTTTNLLPYSTDYGVTWKYATLPYTQDWSWSFPCAPTFVHTPEYPNIKDPESLTLISNSTSNAAITRDGISWEATQKPVVYKTVSLERSYKLSSGIYIDLGYRVTDNEDTYRQSYSNTVAISNDGITWTYHALPETMFCSHIIEFNNKIILFPYCHCTDWFFPELSSYGNQTKGAYSTDGGKTWTAFTTPSNKPFYEPIIFNNKLILIHQYPYKSQFDVESASKLTSAVIKEYKTTYYSSDGITYTAVTLPSGNRIDDVVKTPTHLLIAYSWYDRTMGTGDTGYGVFYTTTGTSWTQAKISTSSSTSTQYTKLQYMPNLSMCLLKTEKGIYKSTTYTSWTKMAIDSTSINTSWSNVHLINDTLFVIDNTNKKLHKSTDKGAHWTSVGTIQKSVVEETALYYYKGYYVLARLNTHYSGLKLAPCYQGINSGQVYSPLKTDKFNALLYSLDCDTWSTTKPDLSDIIKGD